MDKKKQITEGAKLATVTARRNAISNTVYVCIDKDNNIFEFIPIEEILLNPNSTNPIKLSEYINKVKTKISKLENEIKNIKTSISTITKNNQILLEAVESLSAYVDKQRFL